MNFTRRNLYDGLRADGIHILSDADLSFALKNIIDVVVRINMKRKFTARLDLCDTDIHVLCPFG
jgi:hypothetical protein